MPNVTSQLDSDFHIKSGYQPRPKPVYFIDSVTAERGIVWQPDINPLAALLARRLGWSRIIDLGCGRAEKLVQLHPEFSLTGVDYGENMQFCREHYDFGR
jgi:hypothetical protein